ncbi:MAG: hypothetical protein QOF33_4245 [Thermomicrobiales bacterium]|jgi:hypothetical protein|nr:hypothetical protein [Thermomicrobiales bacterium]MEA2527776.1 hypothetical protein [Thermomicrobiales bacterium]MEA2586160.1 hypothetical protein [Thermomicrobiales bacterium]
MGELRVNRRRVVTTAALAVPVIVLAARDLPHEKGTLAMAQQATPVVTSEATGQDQPIGQAETPPWTFTVLQFQDPYSGRITQPRDQQPGTRYVGAEVRIANGSDQPLDFSNADVLLRDADGVSYAGGRVVGSEPKLVSQNLPDGERTRGWVWFAVPEDVTIVEIRFVGPSPVFTVSLAEQ